MLKTMKQAEFDILFDDGKFLFDYFKHIQQYPDSLLSKILGVYQVRIKKQSPIYFFITENLIGADYHKISSIYDLKGATFDRRTDLGRSDDESALKVLKDVNFVEAGEDMEIEVEHRRRILEMIEVDTKLLAKHGLIDYSMLFIEIASKSTEREDIDAGAASLAYDDLSGRV